ncbi:MAG: nitroreductase family protein [Clostridia bacterium]|nr:nitroreductase family protein [Clostridia bacterium]
MTNAVLQAIADRRSIRSYKPEQITDEQLSAIMTAALQAPSARNSQPWHFTVVQDKALIERINESFRTEFLKQVGDSPMRAHIEDPAYSVFYHAPTVIFVSTNMDGARVYARHDCGLAVENIALAAHSLGLGTVILGMPREAFTGPDGDEFRSLLQFPEGYDFMVAVSVGVPAGTKEAHMIDDGLVTYIK